MKKHLIVFRNKMILGIALSTALVISISLGAFAYAMPYSYVSLDVNPSIKITAKELRISPGKLNITEKLKANSENPDSIVTSDWISELPTT